MSFLDVFAELSRPTVNAKPWMAGKKFVRVTEQLLSQVIDACIASGLYSIDLETTGLDVRVFNGKTVDTITGICLSPDGETGYYIPILHPEFMQYCIPFSKVLPEMQRLEKSPAVAIFHRGKFDQEFLQFNGFAPIGEWDDPKHWEDTLILAYLRDTRAKQKGLKFLSKTELDMEMIELEELFSEEDSKDGLNFGKLDPSWDPVIWYAASDAICTYLLYKKLRDAATAPKEGVPSQEPVYLIEKLGVAATRWMERNRIPIDRAKVMELIRLGQHEWLPALLDVYNEAAKALGRDITPTFVKLLTGELLDGRFRFDPENIEVGIMDSVERARNEAERRKLDPGAQNTKGKWKVETLQKRVATLQIPGQPATKGTEVVDFPLVYDILKPADMGSLLRELGVDGLRATATGQVATSADVIDMVLEEAGDEFPYIKKVKRFREVAKAISTHLLPVYEGTRPELSPDGRIHINFEGHKTDTARFSTPQDRDSKGWTGKTRWNLHSIPAGRKKDIPACLKRVREIVKAKKGWKIVAIDYSGQELRVVTNFSREPLWEKEFFRCSGCGHEFPQAEVIPPPPEPPPPFCPDCGSDSIGDLHTLTAIALYGPAVTEMSDFKDKRGKSKSVNFALCYGGGGAAVVRAADVDKEEGWRIKRQFDKTYRGLSAWWAKQREYAKQHKLVLTAFNRRIPVPDIDSPDGGFRSKAERNAVNGPIQATGSDVMKWAMGLVYRECKKRGWLEKVRMIITIHDELVYEIEDSILQEAVEVLKDLMLKKATSKLAWRIPLTCDIEAGDDWTVPWNLTKITYGKAKMPEALAAFWRLRSKEGQEVEVSAVRNERPEATEEPATGIPLSAEAEMPVLKKGEPFVYTVKPLDMTMSFMSRLAKVLVRCRGRGTHPMRLVTETGMSLLDEEILVNPGEVFTLLNAPDM
jgi:DNA polymerase I-like protein with 3'-5' exonuclease and polymerase domains